MSAMQCNDIFYKKIDILNQKCYNVPAKDDFYKKGITLKILKG